MYTKNILKKIFKKNGLFFLDKYYIFSSKCTEYLQIVKFFCELIIFLKSNYFSSRRTFYSNKRDRQPHELLIYEDVVVGNQSSCLYQSKFKLQLSLSNADLLFREKAQSKLRFDPPLCACVALRTRESMASSTMWSLTVRKKLVFLDIKNVFTWKIFCFLYSHQKKSSEKLISECNPKKNLRYLYFKKMHFN